MGHVFQTIIHSLGEAEKLYPSGKNVPYNNNNTPNPVRVKHFKYVVNVGSFQLYFCLKLSFKLDASFCDYSLQLDLHS